MEKRPLPRLLITGFFFALLSGSILGVEDTEARIIKASEELFDPSTSKEKIVEDALANVRQGDEGDAAKLILELVLMIVTPISG